jgi:hypothetical protein
MWSMSSEKPITLKLKNETSEDVVDALVHSRRYETAQLRQVVVIFASS